MARRTTVGDDAAAIGDAVSAALARSGIVLVTGGLGPTADDVTKKAVAELFQAPLEFQPSVWDALVARFARMGRVPSPVNRCQAEVPRGATVLPNRWGTAPGLWLEGSPGIVIMLPGVPHEMRNLLTHEVLPRLTSRAGSGVVRSRAVRTWGVPESTDVRQPACQRWHRPAAGGAGVEPRFGQLLRHLRPRRRGRLPRRHRDGARSTPRTPSGSSSATSARTAASCWPPARSA